MKKGISLALAAAMALGSFIGCVNVSAENTAEASQEIMEITTDSGLLSRPNRQSNLKMPKF